MSSIFQEGPTLDTFASKLGAYCAQLGCTSKVIAERCGLSASALSRYRRGQRAPVRGSATVDELARGLAELFAESGSEDAPAEAEILEALTAALEHPCEVARSFCLRLDQIMSQLGVRNAEMARHLGIDPSYLSRLRSAQRVPGDLDKTARSCSKLLARRAVKDGACEEVCATIGAPEVYDDTRRLSKALCSWLRGIG